MNIHLCANWIQTGPEEYASMCESTKMIVAQKWFMLHASQAHILKALFSSDKMAPWFWKSIKKWLSYSRFKSHQVSCRCQLFYLQAKMQWAQAIYSVLFCSTASCSFILWSTCFIHKCFGFHSDNMFVNIQN